jgi:hypothetical protein
MPEMRTLGTIPARRFAHAVWPEREGVCLHGGCHRRLRPQARAQRQRSVRRDLPSGTNTAATRLACQGGAGAFSDHGACACPGSATKISEQFFGVVRESNAYEVRMGNRSYFATYGLLAGSIRLRPRAMRANKTGRSSVWVCRGKAARHG